MNSDSVVFPVMFDNPLGVTFEQAKLIHKELARGSSIIQLPTAAIRPIVNRSRNTR
jgi:hypothetical protein